MSQEENLTHIRQILFGQQESEYNAKLQKLYAYYVNLDGELQKIQAIQNDLTAKIIAETQQRQAEQAKLEQNLNALEQRMLKQLASIKNKLEQENKQLRDIIKDLIGQIQEQNSKNNKQFMQLQQKITNLHAEKLNRQDLAGLFSELVPRLSSQIKAGGANEHEKRRK
jgi:hypothetical protein